MKAAFAEAQEGRAPPDVYASRLGVSAKVITRSNAVKATTNGQRVGDVYKRQGIISGTLWKN